MNCNECRQVLPLDQQIAKNSDILFEVYTLRKVLEDIDLNWSAFDVNDSFIVKGFPATIVAVEENSAYDSFGDYVGTGFIVFKLSDGNTTKNYKLEIQADSYGNSRSVDLYSLVEVSVSPKTVVVWDEV